MRTLIVSALAAAGLLSGAPAYAGPFGFDDPAAVVKEITDPIAEAKADDAVQVIKKYIQPTPGSQFNFASLTAGLKVVSGAGKADLVDKLRDAKYGNSVEEIVQYLHFPPTDNPVNQYLFLRFMFMKTANGWQLTFFTFATSGIFPPENWHGY